MQDGVWKCQDKLYGPPDTVPGWHQCGGNGGNCGSKPGYDCADAAYPGARCEDGYDCTRQVGYLALCCGFPTLWSHLHNCQWMTYTSSVKDRMQHTLGDCCLIVSSAWSYHPRAACVVAEAQPTTFPVPISVLRFKTGVRSVCIQ